MVDLVDNDDFAEYLIESWRTKPRCSPEVYAEIAFAHMLGHKPVVVGVLRGGKAV